LRPDKNNSWLRFRYGRLSVDSDDQNFNKKNFANGGDIDDDDVFMGCKVDTKCSNKINGHDDDENQYLDGNGNKINDKNHNDEHHQVVECACLEMDDNSATKIERKMNEINQTNGGGGGGVGSGSSGMNGKVMSRLEAMALSDDDDYGELQLFMSCLELYVIFAT